MKSLTSINPWLRRLRQIKRHLFGGERQLSGALLEIRLRIDDPRRREALYDAAEALWLSGLDVETFRDAVRRLIDKQEEKSS